MAPVEAQQEAGLITDESVDQIGVDLGLPPIVRGPWQQEAGNEFPLTQPGVERIANTIGDMFGEQGVIENEERVFEVIETALNGETEAKIEAQRELINMMGELSEGKELSYEEHDWEPLPEDSAEAKKLGNTFARLVDMGYLQHLDEISAKDVRALGLDHEATLQAAVEINKRMQAGEEVSREEMDNIIYEKHTGQELRVQRAANRTTMEAMALGATQEVALAGKKGRKLEPTVTVPRSQQTPGEFVFTDPGTRGIAQIGKMSRSVVTLLPKQSRLRQTAISTLLPKHCKEQGKNPAHG